MIQVTELPEIVGVTEIAQLTGRSKRTIYGWIRLNKLQPGVYMGNGMFNLRQLKHWDRYKAALERKYGTDAGWIRDTRRGFVTRKIVSENHAEHNVMKQSGHRTRDTVKRYRIDQLRDQVAVMQSKRNIFNAASGF